MPGVHMRRSDKEVTDPSELVKPLREADYVTLALCRDNVPYIATLSHGYDEANNRIYFHCAREGKKVDYFRANPVVWGQALIDGGYQQGSCDHLYHTTQFRGVVSFVEEYEEKRRALGIMVKQLDDNPEGIIERQVKPDSVSKVLIGRIDVVEMTGKKADKIIVSL
jgi:nitroimidazol reductase NimA-like FMN-containing flavoprotein (pyridoxamine 5'-phosphate oxidase superfamily)